MRLVSLTRIGGGPRPALPKRPICQSPYATLAASRTSLARPTPFSLHPSFFLIHLGGLTATSCLIPVIGIRQASSRAEPEEPANEEEKVEVVPFDFPIQQPFPFKYQRVALAAHLRRQISSSPADAAFTLRQLHLVDQVPKLHLPPRSSAQPSHDLANLLPERWVWRMPAVAALHSILRILLDPSSSSDPRLAESLLPIALRIAQHSLRFDTLIWAAILHGRKRGGAVEWKPLLTAEQTQTADKLAEDQPNCFVQLPTRRRAQTSDPKLEDWELRQQQLGRWAWEKPREGQQSASSAPKSSSPSTDLLPLPANLHPASSISTRSIDRLILHIARTPSLQSSYASSALSLSLSLSNLQRRRSVEALAVSFGMAMRHYRQDLAAQFWADLLREVGRNPTVADKKKLAKLFDVLVAVLRPEQGAFEAVPSRRTLAAVATLARAADEQHASEVLPLPEAFGSILRLLAAFPPSPFPGDFPPRTAHRTQSRAHARVGRMVKEVLRRVVEVVAHRDVYLGSIKSIVGSLRPGPPRQLPLSLPDFNTLISYSLLKLQSPELAFLVLERMTEQGLEPSAVTHNILFETLEGSKTSSFKDVLERNLQNDRSLSILLTHMTRTGSFEELERIVFHLLPELDQSIPSSDSPAFSTPFIPQTTELPPANPPPSSGRSPYLYTVLLNALATAGRVGLAERVFRNARWAAELSRTPLPESGEGEGGEAPAKKARRGWVLPQHAYTIMLNLYAAEVRRGRQLERSTASSSSSPSSTLSADPLANSDPSLSRSTPFVRGWGRHALRVFILQERRSRLQEQLGVTSSSLDISLHSSSSPPTSSPPPSSSSSSPRRRRSAPLDLPPFLRSEAAPIVAIWELEGGSKGPELDSLERAMRSSQAQKALRTLFPHKHEAEGRGGREGESKAKRGLRELQRESWRRGYRPVKDTLRDRERARALTLRKRELEKQVRAEEGQ